MWWIGTLFALLAVSTASVGKGDSSDFYLILANIWWVGAHVVSVIRERA